MEQTLILLKPDAVTKGICGKVITRFEEAGFNKVEAFGSLQGEPFRFGSPGLWMVGTKT